MLLRVFQVKYNGDKHNDVEYKYTANELDADDDFIILDDDEFVAAAAFEDANSDAYPGE